MKGIKSEYLQKLRQLKERLENGKIQDGHEFQAYFSYFIKPSRPADPAIKNQALEILAEMIPATYPLWFRAKLALLAGVIIEDGGTSPKIVSKCIHDLFQLALVMAKPVLNGIAADQEKRDREEAGKPEDGGEGDPKGGDDGEVGDPRDGLLKRLGEKYPEAFLGWQVLNLVWQPFKAILVGDRDARNEFKQEEGLLTLLRAYHDSHEGCYWVFNALQVFDGEMLVFHAQTKQGYRIYAQDIDTILVLAHRLTKTLVKEGEKGFIPPNGCQGASQFWLYQWPIVKEFPADYSKVTIDALDENKNHYMGSGDFMDALTTFDGNVPIIILIDIDFGWSFDSGPSFPELSPKIELVEILEQSAVDSWFEKFRTS